MEKHNKEGGPEKVMLYPTCGREPRMYQWKATVCKVPGQQWSWQVLGRAEVTVAAEK